MAVDDSVPVAPPKIRLGMVGGGRNAFIGAVHRIAARLDDRFQLVAGCFSSNAETSAASGAEFGLDAARVYGDFVAMARREVRLKDGVEAVSIVTPNHLHLPIAREFLRRGIHVICDKPLAGTLADARKLAKLAQASPALFILTHNYTAYPMVREARTMVAEGWLGTLRVVQVEYAQDWLTEPLETTGHKQAAWRTDPARSGAGGATGDIGTHAANLACFVTGESIEAVAAEVHRFVEGRRLDDNAHALLRFSGGARGMLWCSQVAPGHDNGLRLRVYGSRGGLEWAQECPDTLWFTPYGEPRRRLVRGGAGVGPAAGRMSRVPSGHPEGYLEAFANLYAEAARAIHARRVGMRVDPAVHFPTVSDGLAGVAFVDACLRSSARGGRWTALSG